MDLLGSSGPLNEGPNNTRAIHSKINDKIPAKSTDVVKDRIAQSTLREDGARDRAPVPMLAF